MTNQFDLYKANSQKDQILRYLMAHGSIELWRLISPAPEGLGIAQYNARIKEIREDLLSYGYRIENEKGRGFKLVRIEEVKKAPTLVEEIKKQDEQVSLIDWSTISYPGGLPDGKF